MTKYSRDHIFVRKDKKQKEVCLGVSELFIENLNRVEYIDFPKEGDILAGDTLFTIDTVDDTYEFACPVNGEVVEINEELEDDPHFITDDTEYTGWICKIKMSGNEEFSDLMKFDEYQRFYNEEDVYL